MAAPAMHRVEQPGRGQREGGDVVGEGPEQVALDRARASGATRRMASAAARRSPRTSVRSLASMATSVPVPIARPRSAWASAAASLTPSPTIATTRALRLQAADDVDLVGGQHLGDHLVDADLGRDGLGGRARCRRSAAPGAGRGRAARRRPRRSVGLTVSATTSIAAGAAVPGRPATAVRPVRLGGVASAPSSAGGTREAPVGAAATGRPDQRRAWPSTTPSTPRPSRLAKPSTAGSCADLVARRPGDGPGDRVLRGVLERRRRGAAASAR